MNDTACNSLNGTCLSGCSDGWTGSSCDISALFLAGSEWEKSVWLWSIIGSAVLVFFLLVVIVCRFMRPKGQHNRSKNVSTDGQELNSNENVSSLQQRPLPVPEYNNYSLDTSQDCIEYYVSYDDTKNNSRYGTPLADLRKYVEKYKDAFKKEFELIPTESEAPCSVGKLTHLKSKNRFQNITPYDHNRVILNIPENTDSSDYINASLITDVRCNRFGNVVGEKMVATQGPKENTVDDFWRMVYQLETQVIVMLCNLEENGKEISKRYWPDSGSENFGYITISLQNEQSWPHFTCRHLRATKKSSEPLNIVQWQFTAWPEQGLPENARTILSFRRKVRQSMVKNRYTVVHCSAGAGRTGMFLAIDYLMEEGGLEKYVDVPGCVRLLRKQRPRMVSNLSQYEFIYTTLVAHASTGDTTCSSEDFKKSYANLQKVVNGKTSLETQFDILVEETSDVSSIESQQSRAGIDGGKAIVVQSITCKGSYHISDVSKPVRPEDYWSSLPENCTTFVLLDCNNIFEQVFPTEERMISTTSTIFLMDSASEIYGTCFKIGISSGTRDESIYKNSSDNIYSNDCCVDDAKELTFLHVTIPTTKVMSSDVVESLHSELINALDNNGIISIQYNSRMGSEPGLAGFLVAAWNAMEMIEHYDDVDIFEISRKLRKIDGRIIPDLVSYTALHEVVLEYSTK